MKKIIVFALLSFVSCNQSPKQTTQSVSYDYDLVEDANKGLKYPIDDNTSFGFTVLYPYIDRSGKEYLTFRPVRANSIMFYDLPTGEHLFDVKYDLEGSNGIGRLTGYYIENLDNIYLTSHQKFGLVKTDTTGVIKQFIPYGKTDRGFDVTPSFTSEPYKPLTIYNSKIYITQQISMAVQTKISKVPVSIEIDTVAHIIKEQSLRFPPFVTKEEISTMLLGFWFNRSFDGKRFLYSFEMDEKIYITDIDTDAEYTVPVRSKYIKKITNHKATNDSERNSYLFLNEVSRYSHIYYDKYRDVYYRFIHLPAEHPTDKDVRAAELWRYGSARFSIIILDKDLNIIGETLFPEYTYNSRVIFIHKNGLYISDSHILNPSFDENVLSFKCFTLKKK